MIMNRFEQRREYRVTKDSLRTLERRKETADPSGDKLQTRGPWSANVVTRSLPPLRGP